VCLGEFFAEATLRLRFNREKLISLLQDWPPYK
jgi:hypothetical protein